MNKYELLIGDCLESLKNLPEQSVNCCVTSPPYFGLRDYGVDGQIGLEQTPEEFIHKLVEVFREVRRVLRDDGTLWLNIGDSYAGSGKGCMGDGTPADKRGAKQGTNRGTTEGTFTKTITKGCKPKDLIGIPWMLAFALRADGWYLRQEIIWHKPNPMPESVKDRCTKAHEQIFLLTKSPRYYFDSEKMREPVQSDRAASRKAKTSVAGRNGVRTSGKPYDGSEETRNRRSVWNVSTRPYKGAHFATFPPSLIEPCILAGCPSGGVVLDPFGGSGTTAGVAVAHGRDAIICELNPEYGQLVDGRVSSIVKAINGGK